MSQHDLTAEDLLHNWTRWVWSGETVGNMAHYYQEDDCVRPINHYHALQVESLHAALPWHERMVVTAEYPQKNARFAGLDAHQRRAAARRWILLTTQVNISDTEYRLYLWLFKSTVDRKVR